MELNVCAKDFEYIMPMYYYEGTGIDNKDAISERFSFVFIEKGNGIAKINDINIVYMAPAVFFLNEKEHIYIENYENQLVKAIYFHPSVINGMLNFENIREHQENFLITTIQDCYILKSFIERDNIEKSMVNIGPITAKRVAAMLGAYKNEIEVQNKQFWPCRSRSFIMEILFLLENISADGDFEDRTVINEINNEIVPVVTYLLNNYQHNITILDLTKEFNVNRTTLSKKFNDSIGESIISYLNRIRINMASVMLRDTGLPVSEIMERVGFNDNVHFLRTFKKYKGVSPKNYRDEYCWLD